MSGRALQWFFAKRDPTGVSVFDAAHMFYIL
jgi:hypothetical protein